MVDPVAVDFFRRHQAEDASNCCCADIGTPAAQWASIQHGIYLSIEACGVHRSLGVRVSRIQSTTMDSWKPVHLRMMELGGNRRFKEFLKEHNVPEELPIREKYRTRAAEWYRENLLAEAEDRPGPVALEPGTGHLLAPAFLSPEAVQHLAGAPHEGELLLDKVFAMPPATGSMTQGGVMQKSQALRNRPRALSDISDESNHSNDSQRTPNLGRRICETLSASCRFGRKRRTSSMTPDDDNILHMESSSPTSPSRSTSVGSTCSGNSMRSSQHDSDGDCEECGLVKVKVLPTLTPKHDTCHRPALMSAAASAGLRS